MSHQRQVRAKIACNLLADIAEGLHHARRHPWAELALVSILALALGAGLVSFDIASEMLRRPLAYTHPDRIVAATEGGNLLVNDYNWALNPRAGSVFSALAEYHLETDFWQDGQARRPWLIACVTPQFFRVLGVRMSLGAGLPESPPPAAGAAVPWMPLVLSHRAWARYFNSDHNIVGHFLRLTRLYPFRFEIVGVAGPGVQVPAHVDAWIPEHLTSSSTIQTAGVTNWRQFQIGRLRAGISLHQAEDIIRSWPPAGGLWPPKHAVALEPLRQLLGGPLYRLSSWLWPLTMLFVGLALAAAASIARSELELRAREFTIRQSLGGSPGRILRAYCLHLLGQLSLAVVLGSAVGIMLLRVTFDYFGVGPSQASRSLTNALFISAVLALAAAACAGPLALRLRAGGRRRLSHDTGIKGWWPPLQIVAASAILVVVVALTRSAYALLRLPTGVRPGGVYVGEVTIPMSAGVFEGQGINSSFSLAERDRIRNARIRDLYRALSFDFSQVEARLRGRAGVEKVGLITDAPYSGRDSRADTAVFSPSPGRGARQFLPMHMVSVDAGAISALGMHIVAGRDLNAADRNAVIVNQAAARRFGSAAMALQEYFRQNYPGASWKRIVGVVANAHDDNLLSPVTPTIYLLFRGAATTDVDLVIRVRGSPPPDAVARWLRSAARPTLPGAIVSHVRPLSAMVAAAARPNDYAAEFLMALALTGLIMVGICSWARTAGELRRREREIGIRLTLGATPSRIMRLLLWRDAALGLLAGGTGAGIAWWLSSLFRYLNRGGASGPIDYIAGTAGVVLLTVTTSCLVFHRALHRDPYGLVSGESSP